MCEASLFRPRGRALPSILQGSQGRGDDKYPQQPVHCGGLPQGGVVRPGRRAARALLWGTQSARHDQHSEAPAMYRSGLQQSRTGLHGRGPASSKVLREAQGGRHAGCTTGGPVSFRWMGGMLAA